MPFNILDLTRARRLRELQKQTKFELLWRRDFASATAVSLGSKPERSNSVSTIRNNEDVC
jgi:hypothetical protein